MSEHNKPAEDQLTIGMPPIPTKPIGPMRIYDPMGYVDFVPQDDLTLWELMLICQMGFWLMRPGHWAWRDYLKQHGLERHFRPQGVAVAG